MRSRYSAFAKRLDSYVGHSWHPDHRPDAVTTGALGHERTWTGLRVLEVTGGDADDEVGTVEFVATFDSPAGPGRLHELSRFARFEGRWVYTDGDALA